jgi:hypothetical protein
MNKLVYLAVAFCTLSAHSAITIAHPAAATTERSPGSHHHHCHRAAHARFAHRPGAFHSRAAHWRLLRGLHLTPAQLTQVRTAVEAMHANGSALFHQAREHRDALAATSPLASNYPALVATVKADDAARIDQFVRLRTAVFGALTPAQQTQLLQKIAAHHGKHSGHGRFAHRPHHRHAHHHHARGTARSR